MKSKEEIEKYLGFKIVSSNEEQVRDSSFAMSPDLDRYVSKYQQYYTVTVKVLSKESEKALTDLLKESMTKGDLETASTCHSILMKESSYYKANPNAIGLNFEQGVILSEYEKQQKAIEEEQARIKAEQEAKAREEEQARLKAEQEAKAREEKQARLKAEQEAKAREEEQARIKAEQEEKERQASIDKDIAEYQQYEELISRRPELDKLLEELKYEEFSVAVNGHISERFGELLNDLKKLPQNEREIILQQYNRFADIPINEQGDIIRDGVVQTASEPKVKDSEQESKGTEQDIIETIKNDSNVVEETTGTSIDSADIMEAQEKTREEVDRQLREHEEYMASVEPQIKARVDRTMEEYWHSWESSEVTASKQYEEQQPEKIRPREKSLKDEVGDEFRTTEQQMQKQDNLSVDFWMNRFNGWYSAIDRVSQTVKNKFVKMKSDIIKTISEKLKERNNHRQFYTQEQDTNER